MTTDGNQKGNPARGTEVCDAKTRFPATMRLKWETCPQNGFSSVGVVAVCCLLRLPLKMCRGVPPPNKSQQETQSVSQLVPQFLLQNLLCKDPSFSPTALENPPEFHSCILPTELQGNYFPAVDDEHK